MLSLPNGLHLSHKKYLAEYPSLAFLQTVPVSGQWVTTFLVNNLLVILVSSLKTQAKYVA
jgi:hypothetical protein